MSASLFNHNSQQANPERHSATVIYIDPPMARRALERNTRNRPMSELHVGRLMQEMLSGRWRYNGEAIKWSVDNELLDGQHRLTALARLDDSISLPFLVVRGLPCESQDTMDQGRVRSSGDQLAIDGLTNASDSKTVAGAVRNYIWWSGGRMFGDQVRNNRPGNSEVVSWAKSHTVEMAILDEIIQDGSFRRAKCRPSLVAAILLGLYLVDGEAAREFSTYLSRGAGLDEGNPILALRERLDRIQKTRVRESDRDLIAFFVVAWNAWRRGQKLTKLQRPQGGGWTAETFPRPI